MLKGIDISEWQTNVDYMKLKQEGIDFAIIRCGYGKNISQKDKMFEKHYSGLRYAGIKVGCYLYSYCNKVENAILEARNCLEFIKGKQFDLPIFYDLEDSITRSCGRVEITQMAINFCQEIERNGYKAGVYANLDWFKNYIDISKISNYKIWLAQWQVQKPSADFRVDYWQFTNKLKVAGLSIDGDYCYDNSITGENVDNFVEKSKFEKGKTYTLQVDLNVRTGAGTNYAIKKYQDLTPDGKNHAYKQNTACLKKGTKVTCLDIIKVGNDEWLRIPSGYVAGFYQNKEYIK